MHGLTRRAIFSLFPLCRLFNILSKYHLCSQVGRVAYEMMQTNRVDASNAFFSLDDIYYFGGQNAHDRVAVLPHTAGAQQEISLQVSGTT